MIGRTLSHYEVLEKIGSGGMGEVYLARDTALNRDVALKVLPPKLAEDDQRRARFKREAQAVATLNHPHIVTVYSVEEAEGVHFITMELVRGKTISELIPSTGLTLAEFFDVAIPLADAVAAAHEKGVLHRDLKPANLMMSSDGRLKILDFGLAKANPAAGVSGVSELPTRTRTQEGRIVGTVAYMSPEQAEGKALDSRSDLFSLGVVLYEMATGERPFKGETTASVLSSILKDTPKRVTEVNPALPDLLERILRRCLVKDREHRYQSAKDLRNDLEELKREVESGELSRVTSPSVPAALRVWLVPAVATAFALGLALYLARQPRSTPSLRTQLSQITSRAGSEASPSLSPDGEQLLYVSNESGNLDIYLQRVGGQRAINLTEDSPAGDAEPAFSPDGARIAFRSGRNGGGIFVMGATGESVKRITDIGQNPSWSPDGEFLVVSTVSANGPNRGGDSGELRVVRVDNGEVRPIDVDGDAVQPSWSPHGHRIAFWSYSLSERNYRDIWTVPAGGGEIVAVTRDQHVDWNPVWSPDGRYLYFSSNRGGTFSLWRIQIDEVTGVPGGEPELVTAAQAARIGGITIASNGRRIAYQANLGARNLYRIDFDPESESVAGKPMAVTTGSTDIIYPDVSPDSRWVAFTRLFGGGQADVAVVGSDGTGLRQLTDDPHFANVMPRWSPDGSEIVFYSGRSGSFELWSIRADGGGLRQLTDTPYRILHFAWASDGKRIVYDSSDGDSYIFRRDLPWDEQIPQKLPRPRDGVFWANSWSPDGERLAGEIQYETGPTRTAVLTLASGEYDILPVEGRFPIWLTDGRRMLLLQRGKVLLFDSHTRRAHTLLDSANNVLGLSRDDRAIYYGIASVEADIWMATLESEG